MPLKSLFKTFIPFLIFNTFTLSIPAQDSLSWSDYIEQYADEEQDENTDWEELYESLSDLHEHPININTASREELSRIPFLSDKQIEEIQAYIYSYGAMKTSNELVMIESLDAETRRRLLNFVYIGEVKNKNIPSLKNIREFGHNDLMLSGSIPLYNREGDRNGFLGYKYRHSLRYCFSYLDNLRIGITGKQDAGEPFFGNKNKLGYDHYSYYFLLRKFGLLKTLAIGDYRASFGLGLVINSSFSLGKLMSLSALGRSSDGFTAHSSTSDANYLQGAATTISVTKHIDVSAFVSYREVDATLNDDGTVSTLLSTAYHRTESEMQKKHNTSETVLGGNISFNKNDLHLGMTALYSSLNRLLNPATSLYKWYYPRGRHFFNASTDYSYACRKFTLHGETAISDSGKIATLNALDVHAARNIDVIAIYRFYSFRYSALFSRAFCEGGRVQNESGLYIGVNWQPAWGWTVMAFTDWFHFAWPRYQVSQSSNGCDNLISVCHNGKRSRFSFRYRLRIHQKDNAGHNDLMDEVQQRFRLRYEISATKHFTFLSQFDFTNYKADSRDNGYMFSENVTYNKGKTLNINFSAAYFHTDSYDARISTYERGMLYDFSFPSFFGKGMRSSLMAKVNILKSLMLCAKIGVTHYFDRSVIGTGIQQINGASKTDIEMQLRWKF